MKQVLLASIAAVALAFPVMSQAKQPSSQMQPAKAQQAHTGWSQSAERINPLHLSVQKVRGIQRALNKKGFDAGHVDGIWGPHTEAALRNFQKRHDINAKGHLTRQTLAALGASGTSRKAEKRMGQKQNALNSASTAKTPKSAKAENKSPTKLNAQSKRKIGTVGTGHRAQRARQPPA